MARPKLRGGVGPCFRRFLLARFFFGSFLFINGKEMNVLLPVKCIILKKQFWVIKHYCFYYTKSLNMTILTFLLQAQKVSKKARRCVAFRLKFKASRTQANSLVFGLNIGVAFLLIT